MLIVNYHYNVVGCELDTLVACISISEAGCQLCSFRAVGSLSTQLYRHDCAGNPDNQPAWTSLHSQVVRLGPKPCLSSAAIVGEMSALQSVLANLRTSIYHIQVTQYLSGVSRALYTL